MNRVSLIVILAVLLLLAFVVFGMLIHNSVPQVKLIIDERAVPGWVFVEFRDDCPPAEVLDGIIEYRVNELGYFCTSSRQPSGFFRKKIQLKNPKTKALSRFPGKILNGDWSSLAELECHNNERRLFLEKFVGTKEQFAAAPSQRAFEKRAGIGCLEVPPGE